MWNGRFEDLPRGARLALWASAALFYTFLIRRYLFYFRNRFYLEGLIFLEIIIANLWHFETVFFPFLMIFFLWSGTDLGIGGPPGWARWVLLAVGALGGLILSMREGRCSFAAFHLVAFFCAVAASASALVSFVPAVALLKGLSLFLLFLCASTGVRLAMVGREARFLAALLFGCEVLTFCLVLEIFAGKEPMGNPNSLGAVMGVAMTPILLGGFLVARTQAEKLRRIAALLCCGFLLYDSRSRAGLLAGAVAVIVICLCLKRQRLLLQVAFVGVLFLALAAVLRPAPFSEFVENTTSDVAYKDHREEGLLGSRLTPWQEAVGVIKVHPWFGSGFGTSDRGTSPTRMRIGVLTSSTGISGLREHGNSYLAITEYVGLLGIIPFAFLLFLLIRMIMQMSLWMRRTSNPYHLGIPLAMALAAGLVHAFFEDWLFAVGYYLCEFFWSLGFLLRDVVAAPVPANMRSFLPVPVQTMPPVAGPVATNR
jgi:O-antigen ligase